MNKYKWSVLSISLIASLLFSLNVKGQISSREQIKKLDFLIGTWVGNSSIFENGERISHVPAYEQISFKVDSSILTIDLHSEKLQLHTVINYSAEDSTYYYNPFYKNGSAKYKAILVENKLIVMPTENKRFIFTRTPEGKFKEYGEKIVDGIWVKYFEDIFNKIE